MTNAQVYGMDEASKNSLDIETAGQRHFDRVWRPLIGLLVVVGFGAQAVLPFVSPMAVFSLVCAMGIFYHMAYENFVSDRKVGKVGQTLAVLLFALIACLTMGILSQVSSALDQLELPCTKLRTNLLKEADSETADTYTALHCPLFFELKYAPWR